MKRSKTILQLFFASLAMLVLILDNKTALSGARQGLLLCAQTVVPSLFPFFVISNVLSSGITSSNFSFLSPILRFCKMPARAENLLLVGLMGGYPVGAKCIYDCWKRGQISKLDAVRCLGFCSNAGPAFIFGMCAMLFSENWVTWVLWAIHIISALLVGHWLPKNYASEFTVVMGERVSLADTMKNSISAILSVCGWVVMFRVIIEFIDLWFLWLLPGYCGVAIRGALELANGCSSLASVDSEGIRFILCSAFLGLGGVCVGLQTISVAEELGTGMYFPGKLLQGVISVCFATVFASFHYQIFSPAVPLAVTLSMLLLPRFKKTVAFPERLVYNKEKNWKGEFPCYSERKLQNPAVIAPVEQK